MSAMRIAVVGGGIAGLAAAWYASKGDAEVVLYEASDRLGGKLLTGEFEGLPVETGPDTILARVPWGLDLLHDLGLDGHLVSPATGVAHVWANGRLRRLPEGLVLGVPARLGPLATSGILTPAGLARASAEPWLPPSRDGGDPTIADVVAGRFGPE